MGIKESLIHGNELFLKKVHADERLIKLHLKLAKSQEPYVLVVSCSDSRVVPEEIFSCGLGELFVIRTAGNVINEGELASIEYGLEHLNIKCVVVLGHTKCGAIHASFHHETGKYISPILDNISKNICNCKDERDATIENAKAQRKYIEERFPNFEGEMYSALYEIDTKKVVFLD